LKIGRINKKKQGSNSSIDTPKNTPVSKSLDGNLAILKNQFRDCDDIVFQNVTIASGDSACIIYAGGLIDADLVQRDIIPVLLSVKQEQLKKPDAIFPAVRMVSEYTLENTVDMIMKSNTIILVDGINFSLCFSLRNNESRDFKEPEIERVIKGQHDGFVELIAKNISLIRRRVPSPKLKIKIRNVGQRSKTEIAILYMEDIANPDIVKILEDRINNIETDNITGAGVIEQLAVTNPYSPFPLYQGTERVDRVVGNLMEGRIAILVDNTPVCPILPVTFFQFFQTPEDYNLHSIYATFLRLIRFGAASITILLPAFYIALLSYHNQAIPLDILEALAQSRTKIPYPPIIEALLVEIAFEILREASIRLPAGQGPVIGIVGALALGQTAVDAGLVSNFMVVVVGITAIAAFIVPQYDMRFFFRLARFLAMVNASIFGSIGIMIFVLFTLAYLVNLDSFGQPYFQPIAPFKPKDLKDTFFRSPLQKNRTRPNSALPQDKTRGRGNLDDKK
jgi:spore germination protein